MKKTTLYYSLLLITLGGLNHAFSSNEGIITGKSTNTKKEYGLANQPYTEDNSPDRKGTETELRSDEYIKLLDIMKSAYATGKLPNDYSSYMALAKAVLDLPYIDIRERSQLRLGNQYNYQLSYAARDLLAKLLFRETIQGQFSNKDLLSTLIQLNKQANERLVWAQAVVNDPDVVILTSFGEDYDLQDLKYAGRSLNILQSYLVDALAYTLTQEDINLSKILSDAGYNQQEIKSLVNIIHIEKLAELGKNNPLKLASEKQKSENESLYSKLEKSVKYHQLADAYSTLKDLVSKTNQSTEADSADYGALHQKMKAMDLLTAMPMQTTPTPFELKRNNYDIEAKSLAGNMCRLESLLNDYEPSEPGMNTKEFSLYIIKNQIDILKQFRDNLNYAKKLLPTYDQLLKDIEKNRTSYSDIDKVKKNIGSIQENSRSFRAQGNALTQHYYDTISIRNNITNRIEALENQITGVQNSLISNLKYAYFTNQNQQIRLLMETGITQKEAKELVK